MRRLLLVAAVGLTLVGCGGSGSTSVVLRPTDPRLANLYLQVRGTAAVMDRAWQEMERTGIEPVTSGLQSRRSPS
jgi:hypothetical protein